MRPLLCGALPQTPRGVLGRNFIFARRCVSRVRRTVFSPLCCAGALARRCHSSFACGGGGTTSATNSCDTCFRGHGTAANTPSVLFFGGDTVSLVVLKQLHERLQAISAAAAAATSCGESRLTTRADGRPQLVVVCPFMPNDPRVISQRHHRQYPVARYCVEHNIPLLPVDHPTSLAQSGTLRDLFYCSSIDGKNDKKAIREPHAHILGQPLEAFDVAVVVSFRYFLPGKLLERLPRTVNVHPSLLPRYRGASPIVAPLLRDDGVGGASIIKLSPCYRLMDSGDVLWQRSIPISPDMTIREYFPLVTKLGASGLCECLFGEPPAAKMDADGCAADVSVCGACDWPRTFNVRWDSAWPQNYDVHFTEDPYHAPRLPKDRAIIRWHRVTAEEAYGTWRAFCAGEYFRPTVNTTLNKGAVLLRKKRPKRPRVQVQQGVKKELSQSCQRDGGALQPRAGGEPMSHPGRGTVVVNERAVTSTPDSQQHISQHFVPCTFTAALHPKTISSAVRQELQQLEKDSDVVIKHSACHSHSCEGGGHIEPGSAYFPKADKRLCAVKCREGWFVWRMAALKGSTPQPAELLCQGMAMETGVLYAHLFVESNMGKEAHLVAERQECCRARA